MIREDPEASLLIDVLVGKVADSGVVHDVVVHGDVNVVVNSGLTESGEADRLSADRAVLERTEIERTVRAAGPDPAEVHDGREQTVVLLMRLLGSFSWCRSTVRWR